MIWLPAIMGTVSSYKAGEAQKAANRRANAILAKCLQYRVDAGIEDDNCEGCGAPMASATICSYCGRGS